MPGKANLDWKLTDFCPHPRLSSKDYFYIKIEIILNYIGTLRVVKIEAFKLG